MRISLLHLNIRSLRSNLDDFHLRTLVKESKHSFNAICLIETRLKDYEFETSSSYQELKFKN